MHETIEQLLAKHHSRNRVRAWVGIALQSLLAVVVLYAAWALVRPPALTYVNMPWKVASEKPAFYPGDIVPLYITRCNSNSEILLYEVTRGVKNQDTGVTIVLQSTQVTAEPGCSTTISNLHQLPNEMAPGTYIASGFAVVPDLINAKTVSFQSEPFKVIAKPYKGSLHYD